MEDVLNIVVSNPLARKIFKFHVVVGGVCAQRFETKFCIFLGNIHLCNVHRSIGFWRCYCLLNNHVISYSFLSCLFMLHFGVVMFSIDVM